MPTIRRDFPLFPLGMVALPAEIVPLHIFEERYKTMINECLDRAREFGIVWMSSRGLRELGCACEIVEVLDRGDDGRLNILARGTRPIRVVERQDALPYPAGVVEFVDDAQEHRDEQTAEETHAAYAELLDRATDRVADLEEIGAMGAYDMAATVELDLDAKQELLDLRSENARMALVGRLLHAALEQVELIGRAQARALSNGKVRFG